MLPMVLLLLALPAQTGKPQSEPASHGTWFGYGFARHAEG